ncbi:MAG: hypothetical protein ACREVM_00680 [Burkholderiales bacterium]
MDTSTANSKAALFAFLKKAEATGIYKANNAAGLRAAAIKLLDDVQDTDDVRGVDVEQAALRYHNKHPSELSSGSLKEYQRRLGRVLEEFAAFNENPAGYRPKGRIARHPSDKANGDTGKKPGRDKSTRPNTTTTEVLSPKSESSGTSSSTLTSVPMLRLSYPIRDDVLAEIAVPRAMTTDEARRLCAFVMTLAKDFAPT